MATKHKQPKPTKGVTVRSKELLIEHGLTMPIDDLVAALQAEGYKPSSGSTGTLLADFRQSCRVLESMGRLKNLKVDLPDLQKEMAAVAKKAKAKGTSKKKAEKKVTTPEPALEGKTEAA